MKCINCNQEAEYIRKDNKLTYCEKCAYSYTKQKIKEENEIWRDDGSLKVRVKVPKSQVLDFIDKLMKVTKGSAIIKEI